MIDGKQTLGSQTIKLSEYDEFKGIWGGPRAGLSYQVISTNNTFLEIGYSFQGENLDYGDMDGVKINELR